MDVMCIVMSNFFMRSVFHGMKETEKGKFRRCLRRRYQVHLADPPTTLNLVMTSTKRKLEASLDGLADNLPSLVCFLYKVHDLFAITFFPSSSRSFLIPFLPHPVYCLRPPIFHSPHYYGLANATSTSVRLDCLLHDRSQCSPP